MITTTASLARSSTASTDQLCRALGRKSVPDRTCQLDSHFVVPVVQRSTVLRGTVRR